MNTINDLQQHASGHHQDRCKCHCKGSGKSATNGTSGLLLGTFGILRSATFWPTTFPTVIIGRIGAVAGSSQSSIATGVTSGLLLRTFFLRSATCWPTAFPTVIIGSICAVAGSSQSSIANDVTSGLLLGTFDGIVQTACRLPFLVAIIVKAVRTVVTSENSWIGHIGRIRSAPS